MNLNDFDAENVAPVSFDLIPDGWVEAIISDSVDKQTSAGDTALNLTFTIIQEPHKDRLLWELLNINHSTSEKAKQIARGKLSAICRAVGVMRPKDSTALHGIPLLIKVGHETRQDNGQEKNVIKDFKPRSLSAAPVLSQATAKPQTASAAPAGGAPWKRS